LRFALNSMPKVSLSQMNGPVPIMRCAGGGLRVPYASTESHAFEPSGPGSMSTISFGMIMALVSAMKW